MKSKLITLAVNALIILCIILIGISPILVAILSGTVAASFGCEVNEGMVNPCVIGGVDYGETFYTLGVAGWFFFFTIPVAIGLFAIYIVVVLIVLLVRFLRKRKSSNAQ